MALWDSAQNMIDMGTASISAFQVFDKLTRLEGPIDGHNLKLRIDVMRAVVVSMMEGYQGKVRGRALAQGLGFLMGELAEKNLSPELIDRFKAAL